MKLISSGVSDKERKEINQAKLNNLYNHPHTHGNHCTNPNCEYYAEFTLAKDDEFCFECGEMSTLYESKFYK